MEGDRIFKKNAVNIAHLPTLMLAIGYPVFWGEIYGGHSRYGITSPVAAVLFLLFSLFILLRERETIGALISEFKDWLFKADRWTLLFCSVSLFFVFIIVVCALCASFLPPHLMQESDAMNYHYSLPRQHLILHSFERIPWSGFDLFLMPVDYALSPYWFVTALPNKVPQFIFFLGLIGVLVSLTRYFKKEWTVTVAVLALFLGGHGFGIQIGSAMLDMAGAYLFLASIDSFLKRAHWLFIIEVNFYLWSKPLLPLSVLVLIMSVLLIVFVLRKAGFKEMFWDFRRPLTAADLREGVKFLRQCVPGFLAVALLVAGPFAVKSFLYAGTPFYPFAVGWGPHPLISDGAVAWVSLKSVAHYVTFSVWDNYGYGRSFLDFLRHFWLIAVPANGVNNAFDYPLGLTYLLILGPFVVFFFRALGKRQIPLLPLISVLMWVTWWMGSQQARWLYIPLLLIFIVTSIRLTPLSKVLWMALIVALVLNTTSIIRAHKGDWGKTPLSALRAPDRKLMDLSAAYIRDQRSDVVETEEYEVAFAQFPVVVHKENLPNAVAF